MKRLLLAMMAAGMLTVAMGADTAQAARFRVYGRPYAGAYYRGYRPYYRSYYRPYYRGYGYGYPGYYGGYGGYYGAGFYGPRAGVYFRY